MLRAPFTGLWTLDTGGQVKPSEVRRLGLWSPPGMPGKRWGMGEWKIPGVLACGGWSSLGDGWTTITFAVGVPSINDILFFFPSAVCQLPSAPSAPCSLPAVLPVFRPDRGPFFFFFAVTHLSVQFSSVLFCSVLFAFPATTFFFPFIVSVTKRRALYADCSLAQSFHRTRLPFPPSRPFWPCSLSLCFPQQQHAPILPVFPPFSSVFPYVCNWASISLGLLLLPFAIILVSRRTGQANAQWLPFLVLTGTNFICLYFAPRIAAWLFALHKVSGIVTRLLLNKPAVGPFRLAACPASSVLRLHLSSLLLRRRKCEFSTAFPSPLAQIWSKWEEKRERTAREIDSGLGHYSRCFSQAQTFYYLKL